MARKPPFRAVAKIDPDALASFQAGIRKRYSNEQILGELRASAERLERAVEQGVALARRLKRLPKFADWSAARKRDDSLLTEWQVYRMFDARRGAWSTFQFLIKERLEDERVKVGTDGHLS